MAVWTYYTHRSSDGEPVGELPLSDVTITDNLSAGSTGQGTLSIDDPAAARTLTAPWLREITAVRDGVIAMHGPIVARRPSTKDRTVQISWASPHAYFAKRVTEAGRQYNREQFSLVRSLITDAMAKTGGALYRLTVTPNASPKTIRLDVGGTERRVVTDVIDDLASDPDTGFDYRWDYSWASAAQHTVNRVFTLGYPLIGRDLSALRVVEVDADLIDLQDPEDGLTACNRYHALGAGTGTKRLRAVANSGSSLVAGYPLLEEVGDHSDIKNQTVLQGIANGMRNALIPGSRTITSEHTISADLPYGAVDLGDTVRVRLMAGVENLDLVRRVVTITTTPATDSVKFDYFDPAGGA